MRLTQGAFSFLPDLSDEQIVKQVQYAINKNWAINVEYTDDPHPRSSYWEMWGLPLFGIKDAAAVILRSILVVRLSLTCTLKLTLLTTHVVLKVVLYRLSFLDRLLTNLVSN